MSTQELIDEIRNHAIRLETHDDLDVLIDAIGDAKYVLLGEASHGTSEFYTLRAELSKRLIARKGFNFIAVEGDWPSCYRLNRYIKQYPGSDTTARDAMGDFERWPTWMWANEEIESLMDWMKAHNANKTDEDKVGFYGIDVYSLWESMDEIITYLEKTNSPELETAKRAFSCFEPFHRNEQQYAVSASFFSESCEEEVVKLLSALQDKRYLQTDDREATLSTELNALVAVNAERYYRAMVRSGSASWNVRDEHMVEALNQLMDFHGSDAKVIIWEHNTHIGDARATDMAAEGMVNVGQLLREQAGNEAYAIGFGTHRGTVIAGSSWGAPMQVMKVPSAQRDSWEDVMHRAGSYDKILFLGAENPYLQDIIGHRAIGVVYDPQNEYGNYVPSNLAKRYDAFVYVDETHALRPVGMEVLV
jgi:erythromycin esterase-like protein